jgi:hypothetical protein
MYTAADTPPHSVGDMYSTDAPIPSCCGTVGDRCAIVSFAPQCLSRSS